MADVFEKISALGLPQADSKRLEELLTQSLQTKSVSSETILKKEIYGKDTCGTQNCLLAVRFAQF